jgi:E3 ubiquitin-protein ligase synoviolin
VLTHPQQILINFVYIIYGFFLFGLQRLLFGPLRPSEVESLSENAWFAITETCLAMTTFRDEMGAWFLVMFTALVTGKVWGWIGDGRIEILEQQPPANPRLFHARLVSSLLVSFVYDLAILRYTASSVIQQARPNMMVMFLFEFAILAACSARTLFRYGLCLVEIVVVKRQTRQRLEERRRQAREERARILEQRAQNPAAEGESTEPLPDENAIDEMDIEVPGWESKGQWVLFLELITDFIKLGIYTAFFFILLAFYGLPIHIMRDLFMTARSFLKSLGALLRYRKALQDLRVYPDATVEDLARDPTCIICREEMQPWDPNSGSIERYRAKKLQCGHILHLGCLKSWLERQQVCPTCRRPVAVRNDAAHGGGGGGAGGGGANAMFGRVRLNFGFPAQPAAQAGAQREAGAQGDRDQPPPDDGGIRVINLGPVRVGIARGNAAANIVAAAAAGAQPDAARASSRRSRSTRAQLAEIDARLQAEIQQLHEQRQETHLLTALHAELRRIRQLNRQAQAQQAAQPEGQPSANPTQLATTITPGIAAPLPHMPYAAYPAYGPPPPAFPNVYPPRLTTPSLLRYGAQNTGIPAGSSDLPEGVAIPPGWSLVPLSRMEGAAQPQYAPGSTPTMAEGSGTPALQPTPTPDWYGTFPQLAVPSQPGESSTAAAPQAEGPSVASASARQPEPPLVVAPNPVAPNWAGSEQLFASHPSIASLESTLQPTPTSAPASTAGTFGPSTAEPLTAEGVSIGADPSSQSVADGQQPEAAEAPSEDKGKGRAVSLEDAEDGGV